MRTRLILIALAVFFLHPVSGHGAAGKARQDKFSAAQVTEAADRFIQRWHETLDFEVLFNEWYVSDPLQRRRNVYQLVRSGADNYKKEPSISEQDVRAAFMAFFNMQYLSAEYLLTLARDADKEDAYPAEITEAIKALGKIEKGDEEITSKALREFAAQANYISSLFRKSLSPEVFNSAVYQRNVRKYEREGASEVVPVQSDFELSGEQEVYQLKRGIFDFYFMEEGGRLKVLTLGFEM